MEACLQHKWFKERPLTQFIVAPEQFARLEQFHKQSELKRAVLFEVASRLPLQHAERIVQFFKSVDKNRDGQISREELAEGFKRVGMKDSKALDKTFEALDLDGNGFLSLHEFTAGVLMIFADLLEDRFKAMFRKYDRDSNGVLDADEVAEFVTAASLLLSRKGRSPAQLAQDVVRDCGGQLSYADAKAKLLVSVS